MLPAADHAQETVQQAGLLAAGSLTKNISELFRSDLSVSCGKDIAP